MDENILQLEKPSLEVAPTTLWQVLGLLIYISYLLIYLFTYLVPVQVYISLTRCQN